MALKELLERPVYEDTGKYGVSPEQHQLFKSVVPELAIDVLIREITDIIAHKNVTGSLIYSIQVLQPHSMRKVLSELDLSSVKAPYAEEARAGMLRTEFLYETSEGVLAKTLKAILEKAEVIGISLRSSNADVLKHKQIVIHGR